MRKRFFGKLKELPTDLNMVLAKHRPGVRSALRQLLKEVKPDEIIFDARNQTITVKYLEDL